jgi:hypothetical protein
MTLKERAQSLRASLQKWERSKRQSWVTALESDGIS